MSASSGGGGEEQVEMRSMEAVDKTEHMTDSSDGRRSRAEILPNDDKGWFYYPRVK